MEPTIYKPSIYKGAGIYKTGAEGGGGAVNSKYVSIYVPNESYINLNENYTKDNLCIIAIFNRAGTGYNAIRLFEGSTANCWVRVGNNSNFYIDNKDASWGTERSGYNEAQCFIIRNDTGKQIQNSVTTGDFTCPYSIGNVNKIGFTKIIFRIALYYGSIDDYQNTDMILDLRPDVENNQAGLRDIVSNSFYPVPGVKIFP